MANELEIFDFFELESDRKQNMQKRLVVRAQCDPFHNLNEKQFMRRYRLSKGLALNLIEELRPMLPRTTKSTDLSVETKVLTALSFYATGSYQRPTGDIGGHSMAQQTVSTVIEQITNCLNSPSMRQKYIRFPRTDEERQNIKSNFYRKFNIPGILGCIDCTHVAIVRPEQYEERFYCRKHYHSLNVQLICDADMNILNVDASFGGATHDSYIWANHPLNTHIEELYDRENCWLLGDSGYPLRRSMLTPILNAAPETPEAHYTYLHVRARNTIERTMGLLKARFRCLLVHRDLHYSPEKAGRIVNSCVILHNMCNGARIPEQPLSDEELLLEAQAQTNNIVAQGIAQVPQNNPGLQQGLLVRQQIISLLWGRAN